MRLPKKQEGFTIIEVMIVLAIAGLIMVVVFIAIPQLQARQRDEARRDVLRRYTSEMNTYAGNNNGKMPYASTGSGSDFEDFNERYIWGDTQATAAVDDYIVSLDGVGNDTDNNTPAGAYIVQVVQNNDQPPQNRGIIRIHPGASCDGETATGTATLTSRNYAAVMMLENDNVYACLDNS